MSVARKAGRAGALLLFRKMWGAVVNLGVMAYLARTLDKSDFGLVAISGTLIGFIQTLGISGIGEYVVFYSGEDEDEVRNAAFWLNLALTLAVVLAVLVAAPFWSRLYGDPRIFTLICLLLVGFLFGALSSIPQAMFRKSLNYQPMVAIQTVFGTLSQLSQAAFAFLGFGVYALAIPHAVISPLLCLALLWRSGFRPRLREIGVAHWRRIFHYTKHVIGATALGKVANDGDTLLIGKLLGMEALGIYDIAFRLANIFNTHLLPIISNVSMPIFSQNRRDGEVLIQHYLRMLELLAFVFAPLIGGMIAFAPGLVRLLYGHNWDAAILPFQILCGFAVLRALSSPTAALYNALGKPYINLYLTAAFTPIFLVSLYFATWLGLVWTCVAVTFLRNVGSMFQFVAAHVLLRVTPKQFWHAIRAPSLSTLVATISVLVFGGSHHLALAFAYMAILASVMWFLFPEDAARTYSLLRQLTPFRTLRQA